MGIPASAAQYRHWNSPRGREKTRYELASRPGVSTRAQRAWRARRRGAAAPNPNPQKGANSRAKLRTKVARLPPVVSSTRKCAAANQMATSSARNEANAAAIIPHGTERAEVGDAGITTS